ncbi:CDP-diacylglycerol--glycerol-3-phosphate 3-phosphatidyltransferase [Escherichia coli]|uniref:CDP-diacylglycerol--glycerol-3-phosphate 3-phosphatidyltransferase n=1 Tax=Escherichia coli TaxID=562 RepID=A0A2X3JZ97_ECOLX|nr:CDP-diacylglycerol--glycerol-3-phosphate 3-phosphatidyltransferase [Escherichia coli]
MQFNIPTLLTLFRVILIPFFVLVFYLPVTWSPFAAALIFCVAAVTDWFDGFSGTPLEPEYPVWCFP